MLEGPGRVVSLGRNVDEERFRRDVHAVALEVTGSSEGTRSILNRLDALNRRADVLALDHPFSPEILDCVSRLGALMRAVEERVPRPQPPAHEFLTPEAGC